MKHRAVARALAGTCLLVAAAARAAAPGIRWQAPAECPTNAVVVGEVAALLGGAKRLEESGLAADGSVTRTERGYSVQLRTVIAGAAGERRLEADGCDTLASAVALILAMTIDPALVRGVPPPARPALAARNEPPPPPPAPRRFALGPFVGGEHGSLPSDVGHVGLAFEHLGERFGVRLRSSASTAAEREVAQRVETGGRFRAFAVEAGACVGTGGDVRARACGGLRGTAVRAEGFGVSDPGRATSWLFGPRASAGALLPVTAGVRLTVDLGVSYNAVRPEFTLRNVGLVYRPAPLTWDAALALLVAF